MEKNDNQVEKDGGGLAGKLGRATRWFVIVLILLVIGFLIWAAFPAGPQEVAKKALEGNELVKVEKLAGVLTFTPAVTNGNCVIFYHGAHTKPEAYAPLLSLFASEGYTVFAPKFPFYLANLGKNKAGAIMAKEELAGGCSKWIGVGHSLGGYALSEYVAKNLEDFETVMLLGAKRISKNEGFSSYAGAIANVIGSRDEVVGQSRFWKNRTLLPSKAGIVTLPGGNHAQYGDFGTLIRDDEAEISAEEQWKMTLETLMILNDGDWEGAD